MVEFDGLMHQPDPHSEGDFRPGRLPRPSVLATEASHAIDTDAEIASMSREELLAGIERLRRRRGAVILAHNYQIPDIQDLADLVGGSLELSREAAQTEASVVVFCGVFFMAETAAILCLDKRVLIPTRDSNSTN
jgi:quinolinate synthase